MAKLSTDILSNEVELKDSVTKITISEPKLASGEFNMVNRSEVNVTTVSSTKTLET